jgi:hypothetical protein
MRRYAPWAWVPILGALGYLCRRKPTSAWTGLAWMLALGFLLTAGLEALFRRGRERVFWVGFLVFGWVYMILSFNHWPFEYVEGHLLTTRVLDEIYLAVHPEPPRTPARTAVGYWDLMGHKPGQQDADVYHKINQIQFRWAWHSLAAIAAALAGGIVAVRVLRPETPWDDRDARRGPRISIAALLAIVLAVGAAFAALRTPCGLTLNLVFTLLSATLAWATLAAIVGRGRRQAFWVGFAIFGWPFLLAAYGQFEVRLLTYGSQLAEGYLPASRLLGELYPVFHPEPSDPNQSIDVWNPGYHRPVTLAATYFYDLNRHYFIEIGHALAGLIVAMVGGYIALRINGSNECTSIVATETEEVFPCGAT